MKVRDIMTSSVGSIDAETTVADAARMMAQQDIGILPVLEEHKLVGIVTDRDITVRAVAADLSPQTPVRRIMTEDVAVCSLDDEIEDVLEIMSNEQVRRMPVCDGHKEVIGIIALADAAHRDPDKREVAEALAEISEPSGLHCQAPVSA